MTALTASEREARPIMTAAELKTFEVRQYGRDYSESDDGYSDMEAEEGRGWRPVGLWGRDGWDLGGWPYVVIYVKTSLGEQGRTYELMQICEGDRTVWSFTSEADRYAAIDYLFLWYAAGTGESWAPLTWEQREQLDKGELTFEPKWRGPCRV